MAGVWASIGEDGVWWGHKGLRVGNARGAEGDGGNEMEGLRTEFAVVPNTNTLRKIQSEWLRITYNPRGAQKYPDAGDVIQLAGHNLLPDGKYLVVMVTEFEPPYNADEDGRDIRISLAGEGVSRVGMGAVDKSGMAQELNGVNVRLAMGKD